ncbi:MAG: amidase [Candidimonas sp.]|nr:amidase [Candidimonas sp.]
MPHRSAYSTLREAYARKACTPVEVTRSALAHAQVVNKQTNAFALLDEPRALEAAQASASRWDAGEPLSLIDGMPITVKEFASVTGWPTRRGSVLTDPAPAVQNSVFVSRLRAAGAVLLGKTRAPEFNWKGVTDSPGYGITRNPWNPDLTPGGSSGGCAAAVAAGVVRVSIGSDAAGSVRIPAAFTGTIGLKPTFGRIPVVPFASHFSGLAHFGPIGASARDIAEVMETVAGAHPGDWSSSMGNAQCINPSATDVSALRIGVLQSADLGPMDAAVQRGLQEFLDGVNRGGLACQPIRLDVQGASEAGAMLYRLGCARSLSNIDSAQYDRMDPGLLEYLQYAGELSLEDYLGALAIRDAFASKLAEVFTQVDVLVLPTVPVLPFRAGINVPPGWPGNDWLSWNPFTPAFNLAQNPVLSYPVWPSECELPIGIQLVAPALEEGRLLALSSWLEERMPLQRGVAASYRPAV